METRNKNKQKQWQTFKTWKNENNQTQHKSLLFKTIATLKR